MQNIQTVLKKSLLKKKLNNIKTTKHLLKTEEHTANEYKHKRVPTENKTQDRRKCPEPECQDPRTETKVDRIVYPSPKHNTYTKECRAQRTFPELLHSHKDKKGQYNTGSCH